VRKREEKGGEEEEEGETRRSLGEGCVEKHLGRERTRSQARGKKKKEYCSSGPGVGGREK
jgi:hypothetical protein